MKKEELINFDILLFISILLLSVAVTKILSLNVSLALFNFGIYF